ncbi:MAG: hypothetical protein ACK8QZ_12585, partial [Anaerolineales bacterium]
MVSLRKLLKVLEGAAHIVVILGIPAFFYQQFQHKVMLRKQQTLESITAFSTDEVLNAREQVQRPWRTVSVPALIDAGMTRDDFNRLVTETVNDDLELQRSIFLIVDFFENARRCIDLELCEEQTMTGFAQRAGAAIFQASFETCS